MKRSDFQQMRDDLLADAMVLNDKKGKDYSGDSDALASFKTQAEQAGITPLQVWSIFAGKHWLAVQSYVRNGQVESEPIRERITDLIVYLCLLQGLIEDETNQEIS